MAAKLDAHTLGAVFQTRPDLLAGIQKAADTPARINLFNEIAAFVHERVSSTDHDEDTGPAAKRRRVDIAPSQSQNGFTATNGAAGATVGHDVEAAADPLLLEIKDISVVVPQRKKYDLCFTKNYLYARIGANGAPVQGVVYRWSDVEHIFYLPVPDKSQVQHNYVILPRDSYLPAAKQSAAANGNDGSKQAPLEPLVFTVPATAPKPGSVGGPSAKSAESVSDSFNTLFNWALTTSLRSAGNHTCQLVASDPKLFHSAARQAYRPSEKAVHVKAFRGSKDGFLFFLPTGILWGFKKPLLFLPLDRIVALSYTSVLQRTFNIVVELDVGENEALDKEIEFGMIDQEDYQGINENYVQRHGLADRSMAEQRKAKRQLVENVKKEGGEGNGAEGTEDTGDGLTELERAQKEAEQQLQDDEDEDEEDYDPGSGGESEGSGSSSEEDDDDDENGGEGGDDDDDDDEDEEDLEGMDEDE